MAFFEGDWKRRPTQRPTGVQFSSDVTKVVRMAREQRQQRVSEERRNAAAIVMQAGVRGFLARRRVLRERRSEFQLSQLLLNQSHDNEVNGEQFWSVLRLFTSFASSPSDYMSRKSFVSEDLIHIVHLCQQALTRWRNDVVRDLQASFADKVKQKKDTGSVKIRVFARLITLAAHSVHLMLSKRAASDPSKASSTFSDKHNRQNINTTPRFLDVFTDIQTFTQTVASPHHRQPELNETQDFVRYFLFYMMKTGCFTESALFGAGVLIGNQIETSAAERASSTGNKHMQQLSWDDKIQLESDVMHRNAAAQTVLLLLYRPLLFVDSVRHLEEAVHATITKPVIHATSGKRAGFVQQTSGFLDYIKHLFAWPAYKPLPFHVRHLRTVMLPVSHSIVSDDASLSGNKQILLVNISFILRMLFVSGLRCMHFPLAKDVYDSFVYYIMHDEHQEEATSRRLSLLFAAVQLQQAWSRLSNAASLDGVQQRGAFNSALPAGYNSFQSATLEIISTLLKSAVVTTGIESLLIEDIDEDGDDDNGDIIMRDDDIDDVGTEHADMIVAGNQDFPVNSKLMIPGTDTTVYQFTSVERSRIGMLRQMCVEYLTQHEEFQQFYIESFVSVATSLTTLVLLSPPTSASRALHVMDDRLALSIWHSPAPATIVSGDHDAATEPTKTTGDLVMTLVSVYYGLLQMGSSLQLFSYVRNSTLLPILWSVLSNARRDVEGRGRLILAGGAEKPTLNGVSSFGGYGISATGGNYTAAQQQQCVMDLLKSGTVIPLRECHDFIICLDVFCAMMEPLLLSVHDRDFIGNLTANNSDGASALLLPTIQEHFKATVNNTSSGLPFNNLELALIARDLRSVVVGMAQLAFVSNYQRRTYSTSISTAPTVKTASLSWNDTEHWWSCFLAASAVLRKLYDRDQRRPFMWLTYAYDVVSKQQQQQTFTGTLGDSFENIDTSVAGFDRFAWDRQSLVIPSLSSSSTNKLNLLVLPEMIATTGASVAEDAVDLPINIMPINNNNNMRLNYRTAHNRVLEAKHLARFGDEIIRQFFKTARPFQPAPSAAAASAAPRAQMISRRRRQQNMPANNLDFDDFADEQQPDRPSSDYSDETSGFMPNHRHASLAAAHSADELAVTLLLLQTPFVVPFVERVRCFHHWLRLEHRRRGHDIRANFGVGPGEQLQAIRRDHVYEDAFEQLSHLPPERFRLLWSVTFRNLTGLMEAGIDGGGLFREFCNMVLKEGFNPHRGFFQLTEYDGSLLPNAAFVHATAESGEKLLGRSVFEHLQFLGRMLGKCLYEMLLVEVRFARFFLRQLLLPRGRNYVDIHQLQSFDPEMYKNLMLLRDLPDVRVLDLDFSVNVDRLGQTRMYELKPGGAGMSVTNENRNEYIHLYADFWLNRHARRAVNAVKMGLEEVIPYQWLSLFAPHELQMLISGVDQPVDVEDLKVNTHYTGHYNDEHPVIKNFWSVVRSLSDEQKRLLLKFVTSCSRPPLFGFKELHPPFTIQSAARIDGLPTASTCMNLLKLPEFVDAPTLRTKLVESITSDAGFELS